MTQKPCRRDGFTLVEVMVVSVLTAVLGLSLFWCARGFGRTAAESIARCRLAQEMNLAVNALARDLGGSLSLSGTGARWDSQFLGWELQPDTPPDNFQQLWLCFDSSCGTAAPNDQPNWTSPQSLGQTAISYSLVSTGSGGPDGTVQFYALERKVETHNPPTTIRVANYITDMQLEILNQNEPLQQQQVQIQLTFTYYAMNNPIPITRTCTLIVSPP
jgi:prepilin-type N-terminal cleavage/methylation domain-containing protein